MLQAHPIGIMKIYQYSALQYPYLEVKVAILQPGEFDNDMVVVFEACSLLVSEDVLKTCVLLPDFYQDTQLGYEALSYVWGSEENPLHASVLSLDPPSQGFVTITRNLDIALRHLQYKSTTRRLWIKCTVHRPATSRGEICAAFHYG